VLKNSEYSGLGQCQGYLVSGQSNRGLCSDMRRDDNSLCPSSYLLAHLK